MGALLMGARHGLYCFGCCWVLFTVLMAAGVMSVGWMLLLTLVVFAEKLFRMEHAFPTWWVCCLWCAGCCTQLTEFLVPT